MAQVIVVNGATLITSSAGGAVAIDPLTSIFASNLKVNSNAVYLQIGYNLTIGSAITAGVIAGNATMVKGKHPITNLPTFVVLDNAVSGTVSILTTGQSIAPPKVKGV